MQFLKGYTRVRGHGFAQGVVSHTFMILLQKLFKTFLSGLVRGHGFAQGVVSHTFMILLQKLFKTFLSGLG